MKKSTLIRILELLIKYNVTFIEEIKNCDTYDDYLSVTWYTGMTFDEWNYLKEMEYEIYEEIERQNKRRCKI